MREATGAEGRDDGMAHAVDHAERETPEWSVRAYALLTALLASRKQAGKADPFMAEDVRRYADRAGFPAPPDPRAWGSVLRKAANAGLIVNAGFAKSKNPKAHVRPTALWRQT